MSFTTSAILKTDTIKKDGTYPIYIRLTIARKPIYIPMGKSVSKSDWDEANSRVRPRTKAVSNVTRLNNQISKEKARVDDLCIQLMDHQLLETYPVKDIKKFISWCKGKEGEDIHDAIIKLKNGLSITDFIETSKNSSSGAVDVFSFIAEKNKMFRHAGREPYAQSNEDLISKLKKIHKSKTLRFEDVNVKFLKRLEAQHIGSGGSYGGLGTYLRTLKARYNDAIAEGVVHGKHYPFGKKKYQIKRADPHRKALSDMAFKKYQRMKFSEGSLEETAQQLFFISYFFRGMNFKDLAYLRVHHFDPNLTRLNYQRSKTQKKYSLAVHPKARKIIQQFLGDHHAQDDLVFPILSEELIARHDPKELKRRLDSFREIMNKRYRAVGKNLHGSFSFYSARHTYATRLKRKGISIGEIQDALGHSSAKTTEHYLASFENEILDENDKMLFDD